MSRLEDLPVAVIGGGPIGLAAAAHLLVRGLPVRLYERGARIGANLRDWGHVRVFSPWTYNVDGACWALLQRNGWRMPPAEDLPTGDELCDAYLEPLAAVPEMAAAIETGARVEAVSRLGLDKMTSKDRESRPFVLHIVSAEGQARQDLARAVVDASGTWNNPNPLGADGLPATGERENRDWIDYGMPDVLGRDRSRYAGARVLVVGAGYSAANVLIDLARLGADNSQGSITWVVRGTNLSKVYGGGSADQLPARGQLGWHLRELVEAGRIALVGGFAASAVRATGNGVHLEGETAQGARRICPADRILAATGQRPDLLMTRELRLDLDPWLESVRALASEIDPNIHSCGTVAPHGHRALSHPEPGFYTVGVKSYGRAPTFLLMTGYEQARSVAAAIAGDMAAADDVKLTLPETGVCVSPEFDIPELESNGCCGGPAPIAVDACCVADMSAKAKGQAGCGCGPAV